MFMVFCVQHVFICSEFSDIFDLEQFKSVLANDVKIVSLLPASKVMTRPSEDGSMPFNASPQWIRSHYPKRVRSYNIP